MGAVLHPVGGRKAASQTTWQTALLRPRSTHHQLSNFGLARTQQARSLRMDTSVVRVMVTVWLLSKRKSPLCAFP